MRLAKLFTNIVKTMRKPRCIVYALKSCETNHRHWETILSAEAPMCAGSIHISNPSQPLYCTEVQSSQLWWLEFILWTDFAGEAREMRWHQHPWKGLVHRLICQSNRISQQQEKSDWTLISTNRPTETILKGGNELCTSTSCNKHSDTELTLSLLRAHKQTCQTSSERPPFPQELSKVVSPLRAELKAWGQGYV